MNTRKETIQILESNTYIFVRHGGNHDIYFSPVTRITVSVKRHDFDEGDMRYVLKEAKIDRNQLGKRKGRK